MRSRLLPRGIAERGGQPVATEPGGEVIAVVRAEHLPRLAHRHVHQRIVPVRQIGHEAHGRPNAAARLFHRVARAPLRDRSDTQQPPRDSALPDRVEDLKLDEPAPVPLARIFLLAVVEDEEP